MPSFMHTRAALAPNARSNSLDVITVKSGLSALGTYAAPEWGVTPYPDRALFDAIRAFQKSNGLTVDGVIWRQVGRRHRPGRHQCRAG